MPLDDISSESTDRKSNQVHKRDIIRIKLATGGEEETTCLKAYQNVSRGFSPVSVAKANSPRLMSMRPCARYAWHCSKQMSTSKSYVNSSSALRRRPSEQMCWGAFRQHSKSSQLS